MKNCFMCEETRTVFTIEKWAGVGLLLLLRLGPEENVNCEI